MEEQEKKPVTFLDVEPEEPAGNPNFTQTYIRPDDKDKLIRWAKEGKRSLVNQLSVILEDWEKANDKKFVSED